MSQHPDSLTIERPIFAEAELKLRARPAELPGPAGEERPSAAETTPRPPATRGRQLRKLLLIGASTLALAGAVHVGWQYWTVGRFEVSTDDAYVQADNTTIAPKVS